MRNEQTLRTRITAVVVLGSLVLVGVALTILYTTLNSQLHAAVDDGLRGRLQDVTAAAGAGVMTIDDPYAQLLDGRGRVVAASSTAPETSVLSSAQLEQAQRGPVLVDGAAPGLAGSARLAAEAIPGTDQVVVVGTSLVGVEAATERLLLSLAIALPVLVALLVLVVRWAINASLGPVRALTRQAARISTAGSEDRLPQPPGEDEITELANTLNAMLDRLRVSFERERAFVDDASHELRTPIAVLRGELELALLDDDPAQMRRAVEIAHTEAEHLSKLAVDLLVLARQRAGALGLERRDVDLYDVAQRTVARLTPLLSSAVQVEGRPSRAAVDVVRIEQLLTNLVTNAAEAGAERVDVHVGSRDGRALLRVVDDGPGFPPDLLDTAFDRFTRADRARTRRGGSRSASTGAGLGLPIAAAIARAHGGDIHISNGSPQGACVQLELPSAPGPTRSEDP